ncbi:hypothetical protein [Melittangium boletus]|uniref:Uncharacterized protein n=1 Tax=Melittangium boletus DSM 14713 TaxID=1294270 RepID=A0A250IR61_9BACT|nr:hypothetical protein [Melittangium boletus]ATB34235.1 hypothetical protein MEBOL_007736 [Melittangium boletus DSM 14713]
MTFEEAQRVVQAFMNSFKQPSEGLNAQGFGGAVIGDGQLYFEYHGKTQRLETSALIHKFRDAPKPGVLEGFQAEEKAGTPTGGGAVDYEVENKSLFLSRYYEQVPPQEAFQEDMKKLLAASAVWSDEVLDRVATRVFGK